MVFRYSPECMTRLKPVAGHLLVFFGQVLDRQPQVVRVIKQGQHVLRFLQADLPLARLAGDLLDGLVHAVHYRTGEVCLGVGQSLLVIGAGCLGEGEEPFPFQVWEQH